MKKIILLLLLVSPVITAFSRGASDTLKFWVEFKDKAGTVYSVNKPEAYLSQRAIERRKKLNIKITEQDFPVNQSYVSKVAGFDLRVLNTSRWFNAVTIQTANLDEIKKILALPFVKDVKKVGVHNNKDGAKMDYLMEFLSSLGGGDEEEGTDGKSQAERTYGKGYNQIQMLNGVTMHNMGYTGKGVVIAILDGGFMNADKIKTFSHLFESGRILGTWDFVELETNVFDDNNHGMNVLSCMAANTPGQMVGTAPDASFWLLRTEDANSEYPIEEANWVTGAEFADSAGVDVINSSLGYTEFDDKEMNYTFRSLNGITSVASRAADIAVSKGIIICNAAGNEGDANWTYVGAPADAFNIITVGGVNADSSHADFSSYGPTPDGRIKPTVSAQASDAYVASVSDGFYPSQGTSFASPILCGMVACLIQANPHKAPAQVMDAINMSASQFYAADTILGYGIPDFVKANRYLGIDKDFDYKKDAVETAPQSVFDKTIGLVVYSAKKQKITVHLKNEAGQVVATKEVQQSPEKHFNKIVFDGLDGKKPGNYKVEVQIGSKKHSYDVVKK